jgi:urease accessory protein
MLTAHRFADPHAHSAHTIELTFEQREKSRLRVTSTYGAEIGISLKPGTILNHGDVLALSDGTAARIVAAQERVMAVRAASAERLTAIAYHIGNRHIPLEIGDGVLRLLPDHVLRAMIVGLGGDVSDVEHRFTPEAGAYGHGHVHHSHDDQGHGGRIHAGLVPGPARAGDPR